MKKRCVACTAFSLLLTAVLLLAGCGGQEDPGSQGLEGDLEWGADPGGQAEDIQEAALGSEDEASVRVVFEGKDMEGNTVSSSVFAESKLTMVNVWATYCSPCLNELPELGELAEEYSSEEFQLMGIVCDVMEDGDQEDIDLVEELIYLTHADFPHLLVNDSLYSAFMKHLEVVPTTFFVNEEGEIIETVLGAMEKDEWKERIDGLLEDL